MSTICYYEGIGGLQVDLDKAEHYASESLNQGYEPAKETLEFIKSERLKKTI